MKLGHIETAPDDFRGESQMYMISNHVRLSILMTYLQKLVIEKRKGTLNQYVIVDMSYNDTVRYYKKAIKAVLPTRGESKSVVGGTILPRKMSREVWCKPTCPECGIYDCMTTCNKHDNPDYWERGLQVYECTCCGYVCSGKSYIKSSERMQAELRANEINPLESRREE